MFGKKQHYLISTPFYALNANVQKCKNGAIKIPGIQYLDNNVFKENSYIDPTKLKSIEGSKNLLYITTPSSQFLYKIKLEPRFQKQGISALANLIRERFNIDLNQNKIAVLDADTGLEITSKSKNLTENICLIGAEKKDLTIIQQEILKQGFFPKKLLLSSLTTIRGLSDYAKLAKIHNPILVVEFSMQRSCIYIIENNKMLAAYPPTHGFKNLLSLGRRECNLPDDIATFKYLTNGDPKPDEKSSVLLQRITSDIKSYIDFFEVQANSTIEHIFVANLPKGLEWIEECISKSLEIQKFKIDYKKWVKSLNISSDMIDTIPEKPLFGMICAIINNIK